MLLYLLDVGLGLQPRNYGLTERADGEHFIYKLSCLHRGDK
jgi:hypothetical protein